MKKVTLTLFLLIGTLTTLMAQSPANFAGSFNGSQDARIPDQPGLTPSSFTVEAWVYIDPNATNSMCILGKNYYESFYFAVSFGNRVRFVPSKWGNGYLDSKPILQKEKWTHVAASYDGVTAKIYIDGTLDTTRSNMGSVLDTDHDLRIGRDREGLTSAYGFIGALDEVRMWNRVLSQQEINDNKHISIALNNDAAAYKGLILSVPFQQADSFAVKDVAANPNTVTEHSITPFEVVHKASDFLSYNAALKFNGTNAYIAFSHDTAWSVAKHAFTIQAWVYRKSSLLSVIYSKHNLAYNKGLTIAINGFGNVSCKLNNTTWNSDAQLATARWNHIAVTFDGTNYSYYINGVLDKSFSVPAIEANADSVFIGKRILGDGFLNGFLDQMSISKRAFTQAEIRNGMMQGMPGLTDADSTLVFSFEGNVSSNDQKVKGQMMGGLQFTSPTSGNPVSPVLHHVAPGMKMKVEGAPLHKLANTFTGIMNVDRTLKVESVKVLVNMEHTNMSHVRIRLSNPIGDTVVLLQNTTTPNNNTLTTVFASQETHMMDARLSFAPAIRSQNDLSVFSKKTISGLWSIEVTSTDPADSGIVTGWGLQVEGKELLPAVYVNAKNKVFKVKGYKAATDSIVLSGEFLSKDITLSIGAPFSIQLPGNSGYVQQITLPLTGDSISTRSVVIRYNPVAGIKHQGVLLVLSDEVSDSIELTGNVMLPALMLSKDSIVPFGVSKLNTASAETEFTVSGVFLEDSVRITAGGPFEISLTSGSGFDSVLMIPVSGDTLHALSIFVRYRPVAGTSHSNMITFKSGTITKSLNLSGKVGSASGLAEAALTNPVRCYPNPASDRVVIESVIAVKEVAIADLDGRVLLKSTRTTIDLSAFNSGLYLVRIETEEGIQIHRLVIAR